MGALCSGKSENPTHLEPNRNNNKAPVNGAIGVPKVSYSGNTIGLLENMSPNSKAEILPPNKMGKMELDLKKSENIKVEAYLAND